MDKFMLKPCCENYNGIALRYLDQSCFLEKDLEMIASLCCGVTETEMVDNDTISAVGYYMKQYLEKRRILEHFFFDRTLGDVALNEIEVAAALTVLHAKVNSAEKSADLEKMFGEIIDHCKKLVSSDGESEDDTDIKDNTF